MRDTELIRAKNEAYARLEKANVAILKWHTAHTRTGREPLPAGWAERREQLASEYRAAVHTWMHKTPKIDEGVARAGGG